MNWISAFKTVPTETLRKQLLSLKGAGQETADAMLLFFSNVKFLSPNQYALRLFNRLGLTQAQTYTALR